MMLMPAGPPALVISGLAELAKIPESEEIEVAKTLTVSNLNNNIGLVGAVLIKRRSCMHCRRSSAFPLLGH